MVEKGLCSTQQMDEAISAADKLLKLHESGALSREQFVASMAASAVAPKRKAETGNVCPIFVLILQFQVRMRRRTAQRVRLWRRNQLAMPRPLQRPLLRRLRSCSSPSRLAKQRRRQEQRISRRCFLLVSRKRSKPRTTRCMRLWTLPRLPRQTSTFAACARKPSEKLQGSQHT